MTEADWLTCQDPAAMLTWLQDSRKAIERKLRLFAVASCRLLFSGKLSATSLETLDVAERYADGLATDPELYRAYQGAESSAHGEFFWEPVGYLEGFAENLNAAYIALRSADLAVGGLCPGKNQPGYDSARSAAQTALLCDLFNNPFRPAPKLDRALLTPQVVVLAQRAYEERKLPEGTLDPSLLAALADALEAAGCEDKDVPGHLRQQEGVHVRGCWVVDLLLNKG